MTQANLNMQSKIRKQVIGWMRKNHYHSLPVEEIHFRYMRCVDYLEGICEKELFGIDDELDVAWKKILIALNEITEDEILILNFMRSKTY